MLITSYSASFAQSKKKSETTFGLGVRPIFSSSYFRTGPKDFSDAGINYTISQGTGFSAGAYVKHSFNKKIAFESGLNYTKRKYKLTLTDTSFTGGGDFKIIGYEIPLNFITSIQLSKQSFMSATLGMTLYIFPSNVSTFQDYFVQFSYRVHRASEGITAGLGYSWVTKESGTIYAGLNFHRSLTPIFKEQVEYYPQRDFNKQPTSTGRTTLQGDYLSIDVRFYLPDNKKKSDNKEQFYY
jgi:hypothetical protein